MTETHTLADRLRARSDQLGLAPAHVAEMAGVNRSFVYDILRGRSSRPSIDRPICFSKVLRSSSSSPSFRTRAKRAKYLD